MIRRIFLSLLLVMVLLSVVAGFFLFTASGLGILVRCVPVLTGERVSITATQGALLSDWQLLGVNVITPETRLSISRISCDWSPAKLFSGKLYFNSFLVENPEITVEDSEKESKPKDNDTVRLPDIAVPVNIVVENLEIRNAIVTQAESDRNLFVLEKLVLGINLNRNRLRITNFDLVTPDYGLSMNAELHLSEDWPIDVTGNWWLEHSDYRRMNGSFRLSGMCERPDVELVLEEPGRVVVSGSLDDVFNEVSWDFTVETEEIGLNKFSPQLPDISGIFSVTSTGVMNDYRGQLKGSLSGAGLEEIQLELSIGGSLDMILIESGLVKAGNGRIEFNGSAEWKKEPIWDFTMHFENVDPSIYEGLPAGTMSGVLTTTGSVDAGGALIYRAAIDDLKGELNEPFFRLTGSMELSGDSNGLELIDSRFGIGDGTVDVSGRLSWKDYLSWNSRLHIQSVNPAVFGSLAEGEINSILESEGSLLDDHLTFVGKIVEVSGTLGGFDLDGGGLLKFHDDTLSIEQVYLKNGPNGIEVNGTVSDSFNLRSTITGTDLDRLVPDLHGNIVAEASVTGPRDRFAITFKSKSDGISFRDHAVGSMSGHLAFDIQNSGLLQADVTVKDMVIAGHHAESFIMTLSGTTEKHKLLMDLGGTDVGNLHMALSGNIADGKRWIGTIAALDYRHPLYGEWAQQTPSILNLSSDKANLSGVCLASGKNRFCIDGAWQTPDIWSVDLTEFTFSLASLHDWELLTEQINGKLSGTLSASGAGIVVSDMSARVTAPDITIYKEFDQLYQNLRWFDTNIEMSLAEETFSTKLYSRFVDGSNLDATLRVNRFGDFSEPITTLPLEGRAKVDVKDLSPLTVLTGSVLVPSGYLSSEITISGTVERPRLDGNLNLGEGNIRLPQYGITLKDIQGSVSSTEQAISLSLNGVSGNGRVSIKGDLDFDPAGWDGIFTVTGDNVEVINQSEIGVTASSDMVLKVGSKGGSLEGKIVIPEARIEPEEMTGSDSESEDVVFVDEDEEYSPWPFVVEITIELGDQVRINGFGLSGNLRGSLQVLTGEKGTMTGIGELYLADSYIEFYGRKLDISRGRVIFDGSGLDSPGLDISVIKEIKADGFGARDTTVGINVNGVIYDYNVELFSVPEMDESKILAYLIFDKSKASDEGEKSIISAAVNSTGKDGKRGLFQKVGGLLPLDEMRFETGGTADDSSLVFGKQLTEDLTVSYDYSLFKNIGFFKVRYDFGHGLFIETQSSVESNGIDLLYSFER